jgi:hypothetical protein
MLYRYRYPGCYIKRGLKNRNYNYLFFLVVSGASLNSQKENLSRKNASRIRIQGGKKAPDPQNYVYPKPSGSGKKISRIPIKCKKTRQQKQYLI